MMPDKVFRLIQHFWRVISKMSFSGRGTTFYSPWNWNQKRYQM